MAFSRVLVSVRILGRMRDRNPEGSDLTFTPSRGLRAGVPCPGSPPCSGSPEPGCGAVRPPRSGHPGLAARSPGLVGGAHDFAPDDGGPIIEGQDASAELTGQVPSDPLLVAQGSGRITDAQGSPDQLSESHRGKEEVPWRPLTKPAQYPWLGPRPNRLADDVRVQEKTVHSNSTGRPDERSRASSSSTSPSGEARRKSTSSTPVAAGARTTSVSSSCRSPAALAPSSRSV